MWLFGRHLGILPARSQLPPPLLLQLTFSTFLAASSHRLTFTVILRLSWSDASEKCRWWFDHESSTRQVTYFSCHFQLQSAEVKVSMVLS
jgi:hypothetical protein